MGLFEQGHEKKGGRGKGVRNKAARHIAEGLVAADFDLAKEAIKLYRRPKVSVDHKLKILFFLAEYSQAKPRPAPEEKKTEQARPLKDLSSEELRSLIAGSREKAS